MCTNLNLGIIFLFIFLSISSIYAENNYRYYTSANYKSINDICSDKEEGCSFMVSSNYPISPKIPTNIPSNAILSYYRYIYLKFNIPENQEQKNFYLEAYDISDGETIITNGDCYFINTTENIDYEIRIYKALRNNSFVRFGFLGFPSNFTMTVELRFKLSISLYFSDIALTYLNSLNKTDVQSLIDYLADREKKLLEQKKRKSIAINAISQIVRKVFETTLDINLFDSDMFISSAKFYLPPFFMVKVTYSVGLEASTEQIFQPADILLSETMIVNGKISFHKDGFDLLNGKANLDNEAINILNVFNNKIKEVALNFEISVENDYYTLSLSTSYNIDSIIYTLRYYYKDTQIIYFEIEIVIEIIDMRLTQVVIPQLPALERPYFHLPEQEMKIGQGLIFCLGLFSILFLLPEAAPAYMIMLPLLLNSEQNSIIVSNEAL